MGAIYLAVSHAVLQTLSIRQLRTVMCQNLECLISDVSLQVRLPKVAESCHDVQAPNLDQFSHVYVAMQMDVVSQTSPVTRLFLFLLSLASRLLGSI